MIPIVILLLGCSWQPAKAVALIQITSCFGNAYGGPNPVSCTLNGIGANHMLLLAMYNCGPSVFSDSAGLDWSSGGIQNGAVNATGCNLRQRRVDLFCKNTGAFTGNDTISNNMGSVTISQSFIFAEYSGITCLPDVPPPPNGSQASGSTGGPGTITGTTLTTTLNNDFFIVGGASSAAGTTTLGPGSGFTIEASVHNTNEDGSGGNSFFYLEDKSLGAAGPYTATFSQSAGGLWEIMSAAFGAGGGGGGSARRKHPPFIVRRRVPREIMAGVNP